MNEWNILIILLNCGYVTWLAAFMTKKLTKHPVYKLNTEDVDFSNFRVLLVYANSPMDNLFP